MQVERSKFEHLLEPASVAFGNAARARLVLTVTEEGDPPDRKGWARIDGSWVHWRDDRYGFWQSWSSAHVLCLDWEVPL